MKKKSTITMAFIEYEKQRHQLLPSPSGLKSKLIEVKKEAISNSLVNLISDLKEILERLPVSNGSIILDQTSIAVEFTAEGGVAWVASANVSLSNSMILTFKIRPKKS